MTNTTHTTTDYSLLPALAAYAAVVLALAVLLFGAGFAVARLTTPAVHAVGHTVSCQNVGGPPCTRNTVLDPAGTN